MIDNAYEGHNQYIISTSSGTFWTKFKLSLWNHVMEETKILFFFCSKEMAQTDRFRFQVLGSVDRAKS